MTAWPSTLPQPLLAGYSETIADQTIRSSVDTGPAQVRRRTQAAPDGLAFTLLLDAAGLEVLLTFYKTTVKSGSLTFTMDHPRTHDEIDARFKTPPLFSPLGGGKYNASVDLEVLP